MKKHLITIAILTIIGGFCLAQEQEGVGTILYEEPSTASMTTAAQILLNNISYETIKIHLGLAKLTRDVNPEGDALVTLKTIEGLLKTDIIQALSLANDKQGILKEYLSQTQEYLEKGGSIIAFIKQETNLLTMEMNACIVDKNIADKLYFDSVNTYDQKTAEVALQDSIKSDTCAAQKRIENNAKIYLLNKLTFYTSLLQKKYDLIATKQETLINHFDVISDSILQELQLINDTLNQYQI